MATAAGALLSSCYGEPDRVQTLGFKINDAAETYDIPREFSVQFSARDAATLNMTETDFGFVWIGFRTPMFVETGLMTDADLDHPSVCFKDDVVFKDVASESTLVVIDSGSCLDGWMVTTSGLLR